MKRACAVRRRGGCAPGRGRRPSVVVVTGKRREGPGLPCAPGPTRPGPAGAGTASTGTRCLGRSSPFLLLLGSPEVAVLGLAPGGPGRRRPSGRRAAPAPVEALRGPAVLGRRGGLGGRFPLGPGRPGVALRAEAGQGGAGTRVTGKRPGGSHGQVRNSLLEGDASCCTLVSQK